MSERETNRLYVGDYPIGTKVHSWTGRFWERVEQGWQANGGSIFPTYGGDASWVELPAPCSEGGGEPVGVGATISGEVAPKVEFGPEWEARRADRAQFYQPLSQPEHQGGGAVGVDPRVATNGCVAKLKPDEPFFVLIGRDKHAAAAVRTWANAREAERGVSDKTTDARQIAAAMDAYSGAPTLTPVSDPKDLEAELREALEPFALISSEGVVKQAEGHATVTTCAEYFHRARTLLARLDKKGDEE